MSIPAHLKYIILTILFIAASINFTRTALTILKSSERLSAANKEVLSLETKRNGLIGDRDYMQTEEFVETKARNDLNMMKPEEEVFIVKDTDMQGGPQREFIAEGRKEKTNRQLWFSLFF